MNIKQFVFVVDSVEYRLKRNNIFLVNFYFQVNGAYNVLPSETTGSGSCSTTTASLVLTFKEGNITFNFNKVQFFFLFQVSIKEEVTKSRYDGLGRQGEVLLNTNLKQKC